MAKVMALNPDGTPFYVNLGSPSSVAVTIGEAYTLASSLRNTARNFREMSTKVDALDYDGGMDLLGAATDLERRASDIEATLDTDKLALYRAAGGTGPW